jgi:hypothetical protein
MESWDPQNLPLHHHESWLEVMAALQSTMMKKTEAELAKYWGIKRMPSMHHVSTVNFA